MDLLLSLELIRELLDAHGRPDGVELLALRLHLAHADRAGELLELAKVVPGKDGCLLGSDGAAVAHLRPLRGGILLVDGRGEFAFEGEDASSSRLPLGHELRYPLSQVIHQQPQVFATRGVAGGDEGSVVLLVVPILGERERLDGVVVLRLLRGFLPLLLDVLLGHHHQVLLAEVHQTRGEHLHLSPDNHQLRAERFRLVALELAAHREGGALGDDRLWRPRLLVRVRGSLLRRLKGLVVDFLDTLTLLCRRSLLRLDQFLQRHAAKRTLVRVRVRVLLLLFASFLDL